jgi:hypothetical protein
MTYIDEDLIKKELDTVKPYSYFIHLKFSDSIIEWLFKNYITKEFTEHYYDSEPEIPQEWKNDLTCFDNPVFLETWGKLVKEYEPKRIKHRNWIEAFFEGNWGLSQEEVDDIAKNALCKTVSDKYKHDKRLWITYYKRKEYIFIYWYGRDVEKVDYWWILKRKTKER